MTSATKPLQWILLLAGLAVAALLAAILFWFDPSQYGFYPTCLFHNCTGLLCPGCGSLRALHQLLHGNVFAAVHFNALLVFSLPVGCFWIGAYLLRKWRKEPAPQVHPKWIWLLAILVVAFSIWRNR